MINRDSYPNAAFAYVGKVAGVEFKLLRHHTVDVKDGNDNETVNASLLTACLNVVDQCPLSNEEKAKIKAHLEAHANIFRRDLKDPVQAEKLINQQDGGDDKVGNKNLGVTEAAQPDDGDAPVPETKADNVETSLVKNQTVKSGLVDTEGDQTVLAPDTDLETDKPNIPAPGGNSGPSGKVIETNDNEAETGSPNKDKTGLVASEKADAAKATVKSQNDLPDSSFAVVEKGGKKDADGKTVPRSYRHLPYKDASGKIDLPHLRNALARMNQIQAVSPEDSTERIRAEARRVLIAAAKKNLPNTQFSKSSDEEFNADTAVAEIDSLVAAAKKKKRAAKKLPKMVKYSLIRTKKDNFIAIAEDTSKVKEEFEILGTVYSDTEKVSGLVIAADVGVPPPPAPEDQNQEGTVLTDDADVTVDNPNKDKIGLASLIVKETDLTDAGRKFIFDSVMTSIKAKIHKVTKVGQKEYVNVEMGPNKDYPMSVMMNVHRDGNNKIAAIEILNQHIPGEILADLAKHLNELSKDASMPSDKAKADQVTAPAVLEKCVSDVMSNKVAQFKKKNGRAPGKKEMESMKSSSFAICTAQLKKSGQL